MFDLSGYHCYAGWSELMLECFKHVEPGMWLEFGTGNGSTARFISNHCNRLYSFDSLEGLPEPWTKENPQGAFSRSGIPPELPPNVSLIIGLFQDSLPRFLTEVPGPISFVHIDCDLYSSTKCVFDNIENRLIDGTVLNFNEFDHYENAHEHEQRAFKELLDRGWRYEVIGRSQMMFSQAAFKIHRK